VNAQAVHGWIPVELAKWAPRFMVAPWRMITDVEPYTMKVVRAVPNGGREETYSNATRLAPTQLPRSRSLPRLMRSVGLLAIGLN
jgi:hypothetical protein